MAHSLRQRLYISSEETRDRLLPTSCRPARYFNWNEISMTKAMSAVEKDGVSIRRASELFGVPKSSLHDRISGKVQHGTNPGKVPYLTPREEEELANFLIKCANMGYPHTIAQILAIVQQVIEHKGGKGVVTHGWWQRFCQRHTGISLRTAMPLGISRAMATDKECINKYFDLLEETLKGNKIFNNPSRLFNCDETGMPLSPKGIRVVAKTGSKNVCSVSGDTKSQVTVLACTCANGSAIPPLVIFDRKTLNPELTTGEVPGTIYGLSSNGWINGELFMYWFYQHFLASVPPVRPILLLMDGHSSHYNPEVITAAAEEKVLLFTLPPHTTHLTQPLDKGPFSPLKLCWKEICHDFYTRNPGRVVTRYDFSALFSKAWKKAMNQTNISAGFKITGVYPFSRKEVLSACQQDGASKQDKFIPESLSKRTGLAYIPLYSPTSKSSIKDDSPQEDSGLRYSPVSSTPYKRATSVSRFLDTPLPPSKIPTKRVKSCGKVLTALENMEIMEGKAKAKAQKEKEKEERKALREAKRAAKNGITIAIEGWYCTLERFFLSYFFSERNGALQHTL